MGGFDWSLELVLVGLLAVTLVHAIRLERALRLLRSDRAALGDAIAGFDDSARQAEAGIGRLHSVSAETAQVLSKRVEQGSSLRDDLVFLVERGESLADRLDGLIRSGRPIAHAVSSVVPAPVPAPAAMPKVEGTPPVRSKAERDLLLALQSAQ